MIDRIEDTKAKILATTDDNYDFEIVEASSERDVVLFTIVFRFKEADKRAIFKAKVSKQAVKNPSFDLCGYLLKKVAVAARQLMRKL